MMILEGAVVGILNKWDIKAQGQLKGRTWLEMQFDECEIVLTER